jgi:hypothetical protein
VTGILGRLAEVFAPWQSLYSDSAVVSTVVLFVHIAGLVIAGGIAIAADWATYRLARDATARAKHLNDMFATHRVVITALILVFASGFLMFAADIETYGPSRVFWVKMTLIAVLLLNGWNMTRIESTLGAEGLNGQASEALWNRLRGSATQSVILWITVVLAGTILTKI